MISTLIERMQNNNFFKSILSASSERIWLIAFVIIITVGLLIGLLRWQAYRQVQNDEFEKLSYQIKLAEKEVSGLVRSINVVLEEIVQALEGDDMASAIKLGEHYKRLFPEIRSFTLVDSSGIIREASIKELIGGDRSHSAYYKEIMANPDNNMIFLGRPFKDPLGASIMLYNRAVLDNSGQLKWIAIASINLTFYDQILETLIDKDTQTITLVHGDGVILSHSMDHEGLRLKALSHAAQMAKDHLQSPERTILHQDIKNSKNENIYAVTADIIPDNIQVSNRLIVGISESTQIVFADWRSSTLIYVLAYLLVALLILYLIYLHYVREDSLLYSEKRFKDFTDTASDWIWEMDAELRFTYISKHFFKLANFRHKDLIGKTRWDYTTPEAAGVSGEVWQEHRKTMENHLPFRDFRYRVSDADGVLYHISLSGKPIYVGGEFIGYRGTGSNITELINALNEARVAQLKAESANKAKTQFLSSMSHELRTPMNAILGYAQILELELTDPSHKESVEIMLESGRHLMHLINDLLDLAKIETENIAFNLQPVNLLELSEECHTLCLPLIRERDCTVTIKVDDPISESYHVYADRVRLKQAILNFLSNAIKYGKQSHGNIQISMTSLEEMVRLSVRDDGAGIADDKIQQLFSPFNRLGMEGGTVPGAGLGLSITKEIIEGMGGEVGVESESAHGTVFWLELPRRLV